MTQRPPPPPPPPPLPPPPGPDAPSFFSSCFGNPFPMCLPSFDPASLLNIVNVTARLNPLSQTLVTSAGITASTIDVTSLLRPIIMDQLVEKKRRPRQLQTIRNPGPDGAGESTDVLVDEKQIESKLSTRTRRTQLSREKTASRRT